jgi:hypothetical protein
MYRKAPKVTKEFFATRKRRLCGLAAERLYPMARQVIGGS